MLYLENVCGSIEVVLDEAPDQIIACYCKSCQRARRGLL